MAQLHTAAFREKAAVNAPQSRRFAKFNDAGQARQRLECGGFSTALAEGYAFIKPRMFLYFFVPTMDSNSVRMVSRLIVSP